MTKADMVAKLHEAMEGKLAKKDAEKALDAVFDIIRSEFVAGRDVAINKFGTFKVKERAAHDARNPKTGETIHVAASKTVTFKPSSAVKDGMNA